MALQAGNLLIVRRHLVLLPGINVIDTGIQQVDEAFSPDPPIDGSVVPSRIMVMPLSPVTPWAINPITHTEPVVGPSGTVEVTFNNFGVAVEVNVLFFDPHTHICPLSAESYTGAGCQNPELIVLGETSCGITFEGV